jgi:hypothetical protein
MNLPHLTERQIVAWARAHRQRTGKWPTQDSGLIPGTEDETWARVAAALNQGGRGLPGGDSLGHLLVRRLGARSKRYAPRLAIPQILRWADAHFEQTATWPKQHTGRIVEAPGETWFAVDMALRKGQRGCRAGSSLAQLLEKRRGVPNKSNRPSLHVEEILRWADAHLQQSAAWPTVKSGPIAQAPGETWSAVESALRDGTRGMPGGETLARLLQERRGVRNLGNRPRLTVGCILAWADAHHRRTGRWPTMDAGPIPESDGDTWMAVWMALRKGRRGLPGGESLRDFLRRHGRARTVSGSTRPCEAERMNQRS